MAKFAIIKGKTVDNIIIADSLEDASRLGYAVEFNSNEIAIGPGYFYNKETNQFSEEDWENPNA